MGKVALDYSAEIGWLAKNSADLPRHRSTAERILRDTDTVIADIGCGAGGMAVAMATMRPAARVVAADNNRDVLAAAGDFARNQRVDIELAVCDIEAGPDALLAAVGEPVDLAWAGHVVHHAADQQAALDALAHIVIDGGRIAVAEGGISPRYLPWDVGIGQPGLHARTEAAGSARMAAERAERSATPMPYGWTTALSNSGFNRVTTINEFTDRPAPLSGSNLDAALDDMAARLGWFEDFLSADDRATWRRLLDRDDPAWLGHRDDLHHLEVRSIHIGHKTTG